MDEALLLDGRDGPASAFALIAITATGPPPVMSSTSSGDCSGEFRLVSKGVTAAEPGIGSRLGCPSTEGRVIGMPMSKSIVPIVLGLYTASGGGIGRRASMVKRPYGREVGERW
jgi:hypothetical protein